MLSRWRSLLRNYPQWLLGLGIGMCGLGLGLRYYLKRVPHETPTIYPTQTLIQEEVPLSAQPKVPHIHRTIYSRLGGHKETEKEKIEHILPIPDLPPEEAAVENPSSPLNKEAAETLPEPKKDLIGHLIRNKEETSQESPAPSAAVIAKKGEKRSVMALDPSLMADDTLPGHALTISSSSTKTKRYKIQLASFPSQEAAEKERKRLKTKAPLKPYTLQIKRIDMGREKGIYYRIEMGLFDGYSQAQSVCEQLKDQNIQCIILPV